VSRVVKGLFHAGVIARPPFIPVSRSRGVRALGRAFERKVAKAFPDANHGQWFQYVDENGIGYCQPDLFLLTDPIWVLEVKLTDVAEARSQLLGLYFPVLRHVFQREVRGAVVVKHVSKVSLGSQIVENFDQASKLPDIPVIHWRGVGPLSPALSGLPRLAGLIF
jgi:hypothetical protein